MNVKKIYFDTVQANSKNANEFFAELAKMATRLNLNFDWVCDAMWCESRFKPTAYNPYGAAGLIQFVSSTAKGIGTTLEAIRTMSNVKQLYYVEKYLKSQILSAGKPKDWIDTYCLVFQPAWVGKPDTATLSNNAYKGNYFLDLNKDKRITKAEFRIWANNQLPKSTLITEYLPKK